MTPIIVFEFITFCGLLGIFLRRNFLNVMVSLLQVAIGFNGIFFHLTSLPETQSFHVYIMLFLFFAIILFMQAIAVLMIKRRSTLHINELTELRG
jgi:hypothetical protein